MKLSLAISTKGGIRHLVMKCAIIVKRVRSHLKRWTWLNTYHFSVGYLNGPSNRKLALQVLFFTVSAKIFPFLLFKNLEAIFIYLSTAQKLIDAWLNVGPTNLRLPDTKSAAKLPRDVCESIVAFLLLEGYLKEDFHFTPYSTISYLLLGSGIFFLFSLSISLFGIDWWVCSFFFLFFFILHRNSF